MTDWAKKLADHNARREAGKDSSIGVTEEERIKAWIVLARSKLRNAKRSGEPTLELEIRLDELTEMLKLVRSKRSGG